MRTSPQLRSGSELWAQMVAVEVRQGTGGADGSSRGGDEETLFLTFFLRVLFGTSSDIMRKCGGGEGREGGEGA